jgi:hypothetical protein
MKSQQIFDDQIKLSAAGDLRSATYRFGNQPKPCIHPLVTAKGHSISAFQMSDHLWHRGIWFTIKLINGSNFWEENEPYGIQKSIAQPMCEILSQDSARITDNKEWTAQATGTVLRENRNLTFTFQPDGISTIDWTTQLTALQDLTLDRTPFTTWGGYGGLSFRTSRDVHEVSFLTSSGETVEALAGKPLDWLIMQGKVDGGTDEKISVAMIDHPKNPRSPSPWYCKCANGFNFMNAAFLFHEPMTLPRGQSLNFRYRMFYRDGIWTADQFAPLAKSFRESAAEKS